MASDGLFSALFIPDRIAEAVSDEAWLAAMLETEAALALAEARAGAIPRHAAEQICTAAQSLRLDPAEIGRAARESGNPVVPLVHELRKAAGDARGWVHWGATSQDILDTAAMLVSRRALEGLAGELDACAAALAALADRHRATPIAGRTLLQQAVPISFGAKAAGWLVAVVEARARIARVRATALTVELGGAAGTLAALGEHGLAVMRELATELRLAEPVIPWHSARGRIAELGATLAVACGSLGKVALDIVLLAQTEVGEVREAAAGGSSAMPHKRNPVAATLARANALRVGALASGLLASMEHEHERAAGAWHAEWRQLSDALALTGGCAAWLRQSLEGLEVDVDAMRSNLDRGGGALLAERVVVALATRIDPSLARTIVGDATARSGTLRAELERVDEVTSHLSPEELDALFEPGSYLGASEALVDRALKAYGDDA